MIHMNVGPKEYEACKQYQGLCPSSAHMVTYASTQCKHALLASKWSLIIDSSKLLQHDR